MNKPTAQSILQAGLGHMQDRAATYDKPEGERSMGATVEAFNAVTGLKLTTEQGWLFQILLKAVRSQQGAFRQDNYEDGAAYFGLMGEAAAFGRAAKTFDPGVSGPLWPQMAPPAGWVEPPMKYQPTVTVEPQFDEARADAIGQNGNDGEHYDAIEKKEDAVTFKAIADKIEPPAPGLRRADPVRSKPATELPNTDGLVDPTGRPAWSNVPSWVKWIGQDRNGVWTGFIAKPDPRQGRWFSTKRYIELNSGEALFGENWVHTLEERP